MSDQSVSGMPPGRGGSNWETEALAVVPAAGDVSAVETPPQPASSIVADNAREPPTETAVKVLVTACLP